jgi:hypothetical protein
MRHLVEDGLPQPFLGRPEVRRLADESGAMHTLQCWEEMAVVPAEVAVDGRVLIQTQELAHDLQRQDLAVGQGGCRPACAQP